MFRFTIRDVLWLMVVVGVGGGWWIDHRQISGFERELIDGWRQMAIQGQSTPSRPDDVRIIEVMADENASLKEQIELQKKLIEVLKAERQEISNKANPT